MAIIHHLNSQENGTSLIICCPAELPEPKKSAIVWLSMLSRYSLCNVILFLASSQHQGLLPVGFHLEKDPLQLTGALLPHPA